MATVPPPPSKRQITQAASLARAQQDIEEAIPNSTIRVRLVSQLTGDSGSIPVLSIPLAQSTVKNLETLLNDIQNHGEDRVPYQFFYSAEDGSETFALQDKADLYNALVKPSKVSVESEITLKFAPQAVFRVRAVNRSSAAISGHGEAILATQFSPRTSSKCLTGSGDCSARIWDFDTGTPEHTLKGHTGWVLVVSWSPEGDQIATGSMDNTIRLWDPASGKPIGEPLKGHTKWITSLSWEPFHLQERPRIASSSKDCTIRVWNAVTRRIDFVLSGHKGSVTCVKFGGTGNIYSASHDKTVKVWDSRNGQLKHTLTAHSHWINHLSLSTDFVLRTGYFDHSGVVPPTQEEKIRKAKDRFTTAATISNQLIERFATASDDCLMYLWSSDSQKPIARLTGHQKQVNHVTFSPDGLYLASAGFDNCLKLWSARDGSFLFTLRGHVAPVYQCCFSADSRLLVSCSKDTTLKCWNVMTGKLKEDLPGHKDEVFAVDWSPDGMKVGSGGKDKQVRAWTY